MYQEQDQSQPDREDLPPFYFTRAEIISKQDNQINVYQCHHKYEKHLRLQIKIIKFKLEDEVKIKRESQTLQILKDGINENKHVVKLYLYESNHDEIKLILERCDATLDQIMRSHKFTPSEALIIILQIVKGYELLKKNHIIHRNLKPESILYNKQDGTNQQIFKISEFGLARVMDINTRDLSNCGTLRYAAPEMILEKSNYTDKVDIFSLGLIFYQLIYNEFPKELEHNTPTDQYKAMLKLKQNPIELSQINGLTNDIKELLDRMLKFKVEERIGWDELILKQQSAEAQRQNYLVPIQLQENLNPIEIESNQNQLEFKSIIFQEDQIIFQLKDPIIGEEIVKFDPLTQIYQFEGDYITDSDKFYIMAKLQACALVFLKELNYLKTKSKNDYYGLMAFLARDSNKNTDQAQNYINQNQQSNRITEQKIKTLKIWTQKQLKLVENIVVSESQPQFISQLTQWLKELTAMQFYKTRTSIFQYQASQVDQKDYLKLIYLLENLNRLEVNRNDASRTIQQIILHIENQGEIQNYLQQNNYNR